LKVKEEQKASQVEDRPGVYLEALLQRYRRALENLATGGLSGVANTAEEATVGLYVQN